MRRKKTISVEQWNEKYPAGTVVRYFPVLGDDSGSEETETRSEAWDLCGTPVVMVRGRSGGVALSNLQVLQ